jgi:hypothetical protein
MKNLS